jgi:hypothetical protein
MPEMAENCFAAFGISSFLLAGYDNFTVLN